MKTPLLSVCLITYNHEKYIAQAIDSILMQNVNFTWELIISDDCSKDKTADIIKEYHTKHPDFIKPILRNENVGAGKNFIDLISTPKSKYIAYLEGDDYWTDPLKLQKQVDFLEANPDYEVCFTNINVIKEDGTVLKEQLIPSTRRDVYEHKHLPIWAPSLTRVFKNRDFEPINKPVPGQDTLWLLYQSKFGKIKLIHEITGTYRLHNTSIYSSKSEAKKIEAILLTLFESLNFIDNNLFLKYYGMIFKKLLELKILDKQLYLKATAKFKKINKGYKNKFSFFQRIKIRCSFLLLRITFFNNSIMYKKFLLKVLNRLFLY